MSRSFTLNQLTEGIRDRNVGAEGNRLISKWSRTGLLRGLTEHSRETMARLLENQAAQLLRESNSLSTGGGALGSSQDLQGFTNIAFPIVRRVFGGLVANELVSIQPMSLPSGLLFYLDYTYGTDVGGDDARGNLGNLDGSNSDGQRVNVATYAAGQSIYGQPTGKSIRSGADAVGGNYDLVGSAYTKVHSASLDVIATAVGSHRDGAVIQQASPLLMATGSDGKLLQFDVQLTRQIEAGTDFYTAAFYPLTKFPNIDITNVKSLALFSGSSAATNKLDSDNQADIQGGTGLVNIRRLNEIGNFAGIAGNPR